MRGGNPNTLDIFWPSLSGTGMFAALSNFDKSLEPTHFIHVSSLTSSTTSKHLIGPGSFSQAHPRSPQASLSWENSFPSLLFAMYFFPHLFLKTFLEHDNEVCHGYSLVVYALSCSWLIIVGLWVYMLGWWYLMLGYCYVLVYGKIYKKIW